MNSLQEYGKCTKCRWQLRTDLWTQGGIWISTPIIQSNRKRLHPLPSNIHTLPCNSLAKFKTITLLTTNVSNIIITSKKSLRIMLSKPQTCRKIRFMLGHNYTLITYPVWFTYSCSSKITIILVILEQIKLLLLLILCKLQDGMLKISLKWSDQF